MRHKNRILGQIEGIEERVLLAANDVLDLLTKDIPKWSWRVLVWMQEHSVYVWRITFRAARIMELGVFWAVFSFGPLVMYPCILTGIWAALVLAASSWSLRRQFKKSAIVSTSRKEGFYA